jgi:hypothetical protein
MSQPRSNGKGTGRPGKIGGQPAAKTAAPTAAATPGASKAANKKKADMYNKDCAVLAGPSGPVLFAGSTLGAVSMPNRSRIVTFTYPPANPWMGFSLLFPLGDLQEGNEKAGFGVRYSSKSYSIQRR